MSHDVSLITTARAGNDLIQQWDFGRYRVSSPIALGDGVDQNGMGTQLAARPWHFVRVTRYAS